MSESWKNHSITAKKWPVAHFTVQPPEDASLVWSLLVSEASFAAWLFCFPSLIDQPGVEVRFD